LLESRTLMSVTVETISTDMVKHSLPSVAVHVPTTLKGLHVAGSIKTLSIKHMYSVSIN